MRMGTVPSLSLGGRSAETFLLSLLAPQTLCGPGVVVSTEKTHAREYLFMNWGRDIVSIHRLVVVVASPQPAG